MTEEFPKCGVSVKVFQPTKTDGANIAIDQPSLNLGAGYVHTASLSAFLHILTF